MADHVHDFSKYDNLWGHTDILDMTMEKLEFNGNFDVTEETYSSIVDNGLAYRSFLNFFDEEEERLYENHESENEDDESSDEDILGNYDSYLNQDGDDFYYMI